jgi:hypothetical protein
MGLVTTPPAINFLYNTQIVEYAANFNILNTPNYTGYIVFKNGSSFLADAKPSFSYYNGKFSIDISDILPLDMQPPPDSALAATGVTTGILAGASGTLTLDIGESYGNPIENTITDTVTIKQVLGHSALWAPFPSGTTLLHSYYDMSGKTPKTIVKPILRDSPEFISVYSSGGSLSFTVTVYSTSIIGTTLTKTVTLADGCNFITVSPDQLGLASNAKGYDINILGQKISYKILQSIPDDVQYIIYENGIGGIETLMCTGSKKHRAKSETQRYFRQPWVGDTQRQGLLVNSRVFAQPSISMNTGYITPEHAGHLAQLLCGRVWLIDRARGRFVRYYTDQDSLELQDTKRDLHSIDFTITQAFKNSVINEF